VHAQLAAVVNEPMMARRGVTIMVERIRITDAGRRANFRPMRSPQPQERGFIMLVVNDRDLVRLLKNLDCEILVCGYRLGGTLLMCAQT
jgi:hypothetical protein